MPILYETPPCQYDKVPSFFDLTHFRVQGRIQIIISFIFWFKWGQEKPLLKFTDLYTKQNATKYGLKLLVSIKIKINDQHFIKSCLYNDVQRQKLVFSKIVITVLVIRPDLEAVQENNVWYIVY